MHRSVRQSNGFTLIELLVVIAVIGLLSSVIMASLNSARAKARDAKRRQDLIQIRTALEMYYNDNLSYPAANPSNWGGANTVPCGGGNSTNYIAGLVPTYIPALPVDPGIPGTCYGYLYNSNGVHYKLLAHGSPESFPSAGQTFYDPVRPTWAWMVCSGEPACSSW